MTKALLRRRIAPLVAAVVLAACGQVDEEAATPRELVVVETGTPDPLMVPGEAPGGSSVATATVLEDDALDWPRFVLFGESTGELTDGKQLVAGTFFGSASGAFGEACDVGFGESQQCGVWSVALRDYEGCISDCFAFVLGRNTTVREVAAAADVMTFDNLEPQIPTAALPTGVERLVDAPMAIAELRTPGAQLVSYVPTQQQRLSVTAVTGGEPLADLWRFFIDDDGATAPMGEWWGSRSLGAVRVDGSTVIAVLGGGFSRDEIDAFADLVHPDSGGEWGNLRVTAADIPLELLLPIEDGAPPVAVVEGRFSSGRWAVGYTESPGGGLYQVVGSTGPDLADRSGSAGGFHEPGPPDAVTLIGGLNSVGGGFNGILVTGFTPEGTATVTVSVEGESMEASIGDPAQALGGLRPWGAFFEDFNPQSPEAPITAVASTSSGAELARATTPG